MYRHEDYKVGWICAIPIERAAAVCSFDESHPPLPQPAGDNNVYAFGRIAQHNVVVACLPLGIMGVTSAARVAQQMHSTFTGLRFALMVGIGGGAPSEENDIRLGDVVVSRPTDSSSGVIQYDYGKALDNGRFRFIGSLNRPPDVLLSALSSLQAQYTYSDSQIPSILEESFARYPRRKLTCSYPGVEADLLFRSDYYHQSNADSPCRHCRREATVARTPRVDTNAMVHYGIIASGNQVMRDSITRDRLQKDLNVLCFEMEASGLMDMIPSLIIRGISDYADSHKSAVWQNYAASSAAAYAVELLRIIPAHEIQGVPKVISTAPKKSGRRKGKSKAGASYTTPLTRQDPVTPQIRSAVVPPSHQLATKPGVALPAPRRAKSDAETRPTAWEITTPVRTFENPWRETVTSAIPIFDDLGALLYAVGNSDLPVPRPPHQGPRRQRSAFKRLKPLVIPERAKIHSPHDAVLEQLLAGPAQRQSKIKPFESTKKKGKKPAVEAESKSAPRRPATPPATPQMYSSVSKTSSTDSFCEASNDTPESERDSSSVTTPPTALTTFLPSRDSPEESLRSSTSGKDQLKSALTPQKSIEKKPKKRVSFKLGSNSDSSFQINVKTPPVTPPLRSASPDTASLYTTSVRSTSPLPHTINMSLLHVSQWQNALQPPSDDGLDFVGLSAAEEQASFSSTSPLPSTLPSPQNQRPVFDMTLEESPVTAMNRPATVDVRIPELPESIEPNEGLQVVSPLEYSLNDWAARPMTYDATPSSAFGYHKYLQRSDPTPPLPTYGSLAQAPFEWYGKPFDVPLPDPSIMELPGSIGSVFAPRQTVATVVGTERIAMEERIRQLELQVNPIIIIRDKERDREFNVPLSDAKRFKNILKLLERNYQSYPYLHRRILAKEFRLTGPDGADIQIKDWERALMPGLVVALHVSVTDDGIPTLAAKKSRWRLMLS